MKKNIILSIFAAAVMFTACGPDESKINFGVNVDTEDGMLKIGATGGVKTFKVEASGDWSISTEESWISVSPAVGRGPAECKVYIDSALLDQARLGTLFVSSINNPEENSEVKISQDGFAYEIVLEKSDVEVADFAALNSRSFEVKVKSNVQFDVVIPSDVTWLSYTKTDLNLDRGKRPRESVVKFYWNVNSRDIERVADVVFQPVSQVTMERNDALKVTQKAALSIPAGTVEGDSLAILSINRALGGFNEFDTAEKLEHWTNVSVWKDGPNKGRVKYVQFFMFKTKEEIPYAVQYLTAAEEIAFYSNANHFLVSLDTGEYITKLTQLKRLTIGAYGLTSLHPDFKNLKNLEYLDLSSNCFQSIPDILTEENFPNLHALIMNANQRYSIYDLSNDLRVKEDKVGGLIEETKFPERLLKWNKLDTLRLSVNYLHGELPTFVHDNEVPKWTAEEVHACDTLPEILIGLPKVLPNTNFFAINFNRLTGNLPDWLLYHPKLDQWVPYSLVFSQEGKAEDGTKAGFSNEPTSLDYYYAHYVNKKYNPNNTNN